jgi:hypothetical protein
MTGIRLFNRDLNRKKAYAFLSAEKIRFIISYTETIITGNHGTQVVHYTLILMVKNERTAAVFNYRDVT